MTFRVERIGDRLCILFTPEQIESLNLREGSVVDLETPGSAQGHLYVSLEEALEIFEKTEAKYAEVYRALAKS